MSDLSDMGEITPVMITKIDEDDDRKQTQEFNLHNSFLEPFNISLSLSLIISLSLSSNHVL